MAPAPVIRLHPDDGVLIARSSLPPGMAVTDGVTNFVQELERLRSILSGAPSDLEAARELPSAAMLAGATGYLLKNNDPERLLTAVLTVAAGGSVLDAAVSELVFRWMRRAAASPGRGRESSPGSRW